MSRSKSEQTSLSYLQSISTHNQPVQLKGATISFFQFQACPLLEACLFFISYIQLISQAFIVNPYFGPFPGDDSTSQFLLDNLSFISKIFAPGASGMYQTTLNVLFVCLLGQHLIRISFTMYIALAVRRDFEPNRILLGIWRMYCKLHDRMICFITSSLWLSLAMNAQHEDSTPFGIDSTAVIVICVLFISHDFLHAITMNVRYNVLLPTKDTLQPKTNTEKMWILTQKALFQILFLFLTPNDLANAWFVASLNLAFSILNNIHCYMKYPFYSFKTMSWYSTMLSITTALNLSFFLRLILDAADEENKVTFAEVIVYWIVFSVLMVKGGYGYLKKIMIDLVTKKMTVRIEMLVHKIFVIKELRKLQKPSTDHSPSHEWTHLIYTTFKKNIHEVFNIDPSEVRDLDFDNKEDSYRLISLYLDGLMEKYPKSCLVRLYAAYYHGKKLKEYTSAMKLLLDLQKSPSKQIVWNSLHFLETMQLAVQEGYKSVDSEIDLAKYIQNVMTVNKLKERILKQARLQLDIFKENNKNQPDLGKIYDKSQKVIASREKIEKITFKIMKKFPDYYLEPQLLLAYYNSILNFSSLDYMKHQKIYRNNFEKYHRKLEEDVLSGNNLYEKETGLIVITSEIRKTAAISYCSKSAQGIFGRDLKGAQAFTIMPPMLQNFYFEVFRDPEENKEFLGKIHRTFLLHRDDYLIEADFYFNIHPFISRGLNYNLLVRPVQTKKEHIIISTTGIIEGFSAGIGALLHLHAAKKANAGINHISKELARSSEACNTIMNSLVKKRTNHTQTQGSQAAVADSRVSVDNNSFHSKEYEKAQNTWNIINIEGRDLMLRPYKDKSQQGGGGFKSGFWDEPIVYHCKMSVQHYGTKVMKVVSLEELLNDYDSEQEIKVQRRTTGNRTDASKSTFKSKDEQIIIEAEYSFKGSVEEIALEGADTTKRKDTSRSTNVLILPSTERNTENLESTSRNTKRAPKISIDRREVKSRTFSSGAKVVSPQGNQVTVIEEDDEEDEHEKEEDAKEVKVIHISPLLRKDSKESPKSKSSTQEKVCRAMKEAFNIKFYPRYIQGFKVKFYFLFTAVFIAQIFLNVNVKNTTDQFSGIKNILKNISDKEGIFTDAYLDLLFMIDLADGRLSEDDLGFLGRPVEVYNWQLQDDMTLLVEVTNNVIKASKLLNNENRDELYQSNVNYYDTDFSDSEQTYVELNGFLASQRLVETFLRGLALAETDFGAAMVYFKQILRNTLNDVLLETDNSFNFFTARLTKEKESFERGAKIVLALTLAMLAIKIVGSGALIWYQYKTESLILLAFVKLNKDKINYISANINSFRQVILAETSLEDAHFDDCLKANHYQKVTEKKKVKAAHKYESVTPKFRGIIRRYTLHFIKLLILIFAILAYTILASVLPQKTVSDLYTQVEQAGFSDSIGINCDLALISSHLILTENNENILMMNTPVAVVFPFEIEVVQGYISQILASVSDTEWNYGEAVSDIFYGDGCGYALTDQYAKFVCQLFSTDSEKTNIISLLGYFQGTLRDRYNKYNASDKSYESLRNITIETFNGVTMPHTVLHVLTEYISDLVDEIYDESTDSATRKSTLNLCLICVLLFLTGTLSWWAVIRPVQETDNKMKNVLQMLPPNLVLSNFILKNYLVKTSYGALNVIRNNI